MPPLLNRQEVCALYRIDRTTLFRWERGGLKIVGGRVPAMEVAWWLEQRDAARVLHIDVKQFLKYPRSVREKLLAAAQEARDAAKDGPDAS